MGIDAIAPATFTGFALVEPPKRVPVVESAEIVSLKDKSGNAGDKKSADSGLNHSSIHDHHRKKIEKNDEQSGDNTLKLQRADLTDDKKIFFNFRLKETPVVIPPTTTQPEENSEASTQNENGSLLQATNSDQSAEKAKEDAHKKNEENRKFLEEKQKAERNKVDQENELVRAEQRKAFFAKLQQNLSNVSDSQNQAKVIGKHANVSA